MDTSTTTGIIVGVVIGVPIGVIYGNVGVGIAMAGIMRKRQDRD